MGKDWNSQLLKDQILNSLSRRGDVDPNVFDVLYRFNEIPGVVTLSSCEGHCQYASESQGDYPFIICAVVDPLWRLFLVNQELLLLDSSVQQVVLTKWGTNEWDENGNPQLNFQCRLKIILKSECSGDRCVAPFLDAAATMKDIYQEKCVTVPFSKPQGAADEVD